MGVPGRQLLAFTDDILAVFGILRWRSGIILVENTTLEDGIELICDVIPFDQRITAANFCCPKVCAKESEQFVLLYYRILPSAASGAKIPREILASPHIQSLDILVGRPLEVRIDFKVIVKIPRASNDLAGFVRIILLAVECHGQQGGVDLVDNCTDVTILSLVDSTVSTGSLWSVLVLLP